ncbi:MAG TPA: hypothetical protein VGN32_04015 [Ktedonobacterales bacterium]|nr:hypothetical protein [Ktedonobacterales bacterium]
MFPIAHVWLLEQVIADPLPAHYLGCVWPDMLFGSPLSHAESHQRGTQLLAYARQRQVDGTHHADEFAAFVTGVLTHGSEPHGFDWYSDEAYGDQPLSARGYAFQRGGSLAEATAAACRLAPSYGPWKAHNIVEMAFEVPLRLADLRLGERFVAANGDRALIDRIATPLADCFGYPADELASAMRTFGQWWSVPDSNTSLAHLYALQLRAKHGVTDVDEPALAALIERATTLIAPDRDTYLATAVNGVARMLDELGAW